MKGSLQKDGKFWVVLNLIGAAIRVNPYHNTSNFYDGKEVEYTEEMFWETGLESALKIATIKESSHEMLQL
jgi:hypothetical protein